MATKNSINSNDPIEVALGGTGAATLTGVLTGNGASAVTANAITQHGVLIAGASNAVSSLGVAASSTVLQGSTGADPAFTATPTVTSITFGSGSALSTFVDWTSFTPTAVGGTTAGTTTYSVQQGYYCRIGNIVFINIYINYSVATGTGNITIGALPFTANAATNEQYYGTCRTDGVTWPAGTTQMALTPQPGTTAALLIGSGSAVSGAIVQMANTGTTIIGSVWYRI